MRAPRRGTSTERILRRPTRRAASRRKAGAVSSTSGGTYVLHAAGGGSIVRRVREFFADGGPLAAALPTFEVRSEQAELAQAVADALASGEHLLAEAGTGIGKSL